MTDPIAPKLLDEGVERSAGLGARWRQAREGGWGDPSHEARPAVAGSGIVVLHVVEALLGGPASYLSEILPGQVAELGRHRIGLVLPREQKEHLPGHESLPTEFFSSRRP